MKYMTATRALVGGIWKYWIKLSLSEILPGIIWQTDCICQLQNASDKYCIFGWIGAGGIENKLLHMKNLPQWAVEFGKLAWQNLEKFAAENCGP